MANFTGTLGDDILNGSGGGVIDTINGGDGNDVIHSVNAPLTDTAAWAADAAAPGAGDVLNGGAGDDEIVGSAGAVISGGDGNDVLDGLAGSILSGDAGNDTIGGDIAKYAGLSTDYAVTPSLSYIGNGQWASVYEVKDLRPGSPDGTDIVYANTIQFANGVYVPPAQPDSDSLFLETSHTEVFTPEIEAGFAVPGTASPVLDANSLLAFGVTASSFAIAGGADAGAFTIDPVTGQLSFTTPPDFEAPTDATSITQGSGIQPSVAGDNVYEVVLRVVDANGVVDLVGVLVQVEDVFGEFDAQVDGEVVTGTLENDFINDGGKLGVTLLGLDGDDTFTIVNPATVDGGAGNDAVDLIRDLPSNLTLSEAGTTVTVSDGSSLANVELINFTGSIGADTVNGSAVSTVSLSLNGNEGNDALTGGAANDVLIGGAGSDVLVGGEGDDTLYASLIPADGNPNVPVPGEVDTLTGGAGNDTLVGDGGNTVVVFSGNRANYQITVDPATGAVLVHDMVGFDGFDTVSGFARLKFADISLDANLNPINNNSAPVIDSNGAGATAAVTVNENSTAVTTVHAIDPNGTAVTYSISGGADAALFQINATTGALSFKAAPNAEARTDVGANGVYDVIVQASDGSLVDTQAIAITVADVNEFAVTAPTDADTGINHVAGGAAVGTAVGVTARATDADATTNTVSYAISGFSATSPFKINAATGVVSVNNPAAINYATLASHTITVVATSADGSSATQTFTIAVDKPNVNSAPVIDSNGAGATAAVTVNENSTAVTTVHATDPNGTAVTYSISGGADAALFQINATTGALSFKAAPNAEARTDVGANGVYDVIVQASDGSLVDTQAIAVTVADVNEFAVTAPTDADAGVNHVASGAAAGAAVGLTARATDADATKNTVSYALSGFNASSPFKIDAATGVVTVNNPAAINYTVAKSHTITVLATSADGSVAASTFTIAVDKPANAAPVIDSNGAGATAAVTINENTLFVTTVHATDANADKVQYSIVGGADAALFQINASTGALSFKAAPNAEAPKDAGANGMYDVVVQASDGTLTDTQAIAVAVADVNEFAVAAPCDVDTAANTVAENLAAGAKVGIQVKAVDADATKNTVTYALSYNPGNLFAINASTGVVTTAASLNYEACSVYNIQVKATSADGSSSYSSHTISVTNVNEAPKISSAGGGATGAVNVAENTRAVLTVTATDPDVGQKLSYSISGGADAASFVIDANTGALQFANANGPDFEKPTDAGANNVYNVQVKATDSAGASTVQDLAVNVTNIASLNLVGNNYIFNSLQGGADDDTLTANGLTDYLYGNGGNDTLIGNGGLCDRLDGGTGIDTASYATAKSGVSASLALGCGQWGDAFGDTYVSIENLTGSAYSDTLIGNALANVLNGGAGNDILVGNGGGDVLTGGAGKDVFDFNTLADCAPGSSARIIDFVVGGDTIDLSGIDANSKLAGNQAFNFVGTNAFTGQAGQLRYECVQGNTTVYADANGDSVADFVLVLNGLQTLKATDFVL